MIRRKAQNLRKTRSNAQSFKRTTGQYRHAVATLEKQVANLARRLEFIEHRAHAETAAAPQARHSVDEEVLRKLLDHGAIEQLVRQWELALETGAEEYNRDKAKRFISMYDEWMKGTDLLLKKIEEAQSNGHSVARSLEFRDAVGFCPAGIDLDESARTLKRLENGEGVVVHVGTLNGKIPGRR